MATIRTSSVNDDGLELIVDEIRVVFLSLSFRSGLKIFAQVELERVLKDIVDLDTVPSLHIISNPREVEGEDRRQAGKFGAFGLSSIFLASLAPNTLDVLWSEVVLQTLMDTFYTLNVERKINELFVHLDHSATLWTDDI